MIKCLCRTGENFQLLVAEDASRRIVKGWNRGMSFGRTSAVEGRAAMVNTVIHRKSGQAFLYMLQAVDEVILHQGHAHGLINQVGRLLRR